MWRPLAILPLLVSSSLCADHPSRVGHPSRAETVAIRSYTVAEGLAHDHVSRIYRDSHGFLWICTDEGLSRFDGLRFINYTVGDGLPHVHVNDIVEKDSGDYWVATDGGLTLFRPAHPEHRFTVFRTDGPPEALFVNVVLLEPGGTVLMGTGAGLYRFHPKSGAFEQIPYPIPSGWLRGPAVHSLYLDADRTLWFGASTGLYHRDVHGAWLRMDENDGLPHYFVQQIVPDTEGHLWLCTRHGLARLALGMKGGHPAVDLAVTDADGLPSRDVRSILFVPGRGCWLATLGGLVDWPTCPSAPSGIRVYSTEQGLTDKQVYALATDVTGTLWIGTRRGGIMRVARRGFQTFGPSDGLITTGTDRLLESPYGGICVVAIEDARHPLRCLSGDRFHLRFPPLPRSAIRKLPNSNYSAIFDHEGKLWISSEGCLYRFDVGNTLRRDLSQSGEFRVLFEDSYRNMWLSMLAEPSFGLIRWTRANGQMTDFASSLPGAIARQGITAISEAPDGVIWIGLTRPGGLFRYREGRFEEVKPMPAGTIQALYRDRVGRLWIASAEGGLGRINNPAAEHVTVSIYTRSEGLSSNELWCLTADRDGRVYTGSVRGVDRIDPATNSVTHLSASDGLTLGDVRGALCDRNGRLWFLSNRGLSSFNPNVTSPQPPLETRITAIRVAGVLQPISDLGAKKIEGADFRWDRNSVEIAFSTLYFQLPEQIRYQFRLVGARDGWSEPSTLSTVNFSHLAPGNYEFLVRALRVGAAVDSAPASLNFKISSPPWMRWWFQSGVACVLLALAFAAHKFRLEHRLTLERVRASIATDLHDDIGASLSRIATIAEAVKLRLAVADQDSQRMLSTVAEVSRAAVASMDDIIWCIDPCRDDLGDLIARLRAFGSDVLEPRGIRWTCGGVPEALHGGLTPDQRRQVFLICKEAIHNVARHSHARNVTLYIGLEGDKARCDIQDDGCGITDGDCAGLGITSMRRRAARLGGEFQIWPRPEGGTQVRFYFPLRV